ncbi:MAG TPA: 2-isopropylmalate synthase [Candidatus Acetothermia bacterium]|nr:2-isopropylmalate synthase [Candidatus Acetothermia bacterium]
MAQPVVASPGNVLIFDTTLRDGEQSPGASLSVAEKVKLARQLARLRVDVIEAGFPSASPDDLRAVQQVAEALGDMPHPPAVCALARAIRADIDHAWAGVKFAAHPRIHVFIATSDIHMRDKLHMDRAAVLAHVQDMVAYAKEYCEEIEFSPEDATRSDPQFLYQVVATAVEAGASVINIPDTVGYMTPDEFGGLIRGVGENVPGIEHAIISVHCHDDLGMATSNTLAGLQAGARQAEVTINGIGERAGNAALEEVVMALRTREDAFNLRTDVDASQIARASRMVSNLTGIPVQANKAIVGANAFAHEAGIHQDGLLKNRNTYEIIRPEDVGLSKSRLVLGKHSGRHALRERLAQMGYELDSERLEAAFDRFKELGDKKREVTDADLEALIADLFYQPREVYRLIDLQVVAGRSGMPTATVKLSGPDGEEHVRAAVGAGPVDATYRAIDSIVPAQAELLEYDVHAITSGIDAQGEVSVRTTDGKRVFRGYGADTDIIVASAKAYLNALNRLLTRQERRNDEQTLS